MGGGLEARCQRRQICVLKERSRTEGSGRESTGVMEAGGDVSYQGGHAWDPRQERSRAWRGEGGREAVGEQDDFGWSVARARGHWQVAWVRDTQAAVRLVETRSAWDTGRVVWTGRSVGCGLAGLPSGEVLQLDVCMRGFGALTYLQFPEPAAVTQEEGGVWARQEDGAVLGEARAGCELVGAGPRHETEEAGQTRMRDILVPKGPRGLSKGHSDTELQQNLGFMNSLGRSPSPPGGTPAPLRWCISPRGCKPPGFEVEHFRTFPAYFAAGGSQAEAGPGAGMRAPTEVRWALPQGREVLGMGPYVSPNTAPPSEHLCSYGPDGVGSTKDFTGKTCFVGLRGRKSPLWNK